MAELVDVVVIIVDVSFELDEVVFVELVDVKVEEVVELIVLVAITETVFGSVFVTYTFPFDESNSKS